MKQQRPPTPQPAQPITAAWAAQLQDLVVRNSIDVGSSVGIDILQTPGGTTLAVSQQTNISAGIVQSGGISARSGTTPGSGDVELYELSPAGVLVDTGILVTAYSISSTTGGVAQDVYVMVAQGDTGDWWLISVDCGN